MSDRTPSKGKGVLSYIGHSLIRNWGYKLLALALATAIWALLIAQDPTITREKSFSDVSVTVSGTEAMKRNGFIVTNDLDEQLSSVTLRASVPQMQYQSVTATNFSPRIDLSRISASGTQEVRILSSSTSTYGTVLEISPSTVQLNVEAYVTRYRIPVVLETIGTVSDGWYATSGTLDPSLLTISGPSSVVSSIVRAEAVQDLSSISEYEGTQRTAVPFRLVNSAGETVESDLLEITSQSVLIDSVLVEQSVYPSKELTFSDTGVVIGKPAEGYEIKSVTISPTAIRAAGRSDTLDQLESIFTDVTVDVTDLTESFSQTLRLRRPSELNYLSQDTVTISVEIGEVLTEKSFTDVRINVVGVETGMSATLEERYADRVTVEGTQNWLSTLRASALTLTVDASGLMAGSYELPVICTIAGDAGQTYTVKTSPAMVTLTVRAK